MGVVEVAATYNEQQRDELKKELLAKILEAGYISDACRLVGIDRATYYRWRDSDEDFAAAIDAMEQQAKEARRVRLVKEVERRALAGSDILLMFATKAHDESYRDRQTVDLNTTGEITVKFVPAEAAAGGANAPGGMQETK